MKVLWTDHAVKQLDTIHEFIASDSSLYAKQTIDKLTNTSSILRIFPETGRIVPEVNDKSIRELIVGNNRLIYKILSDRIDILSILHVRQLFYL